MENIRDRIKNLPDTIDWTKVQHERWADYYGDWVLIADTMLIPDWQPEEKPPWAFDQPNVGRKGQQAVIEFISHAAEDIKTLLAEIDRLNNK